MGKNFPTHIVAVGGLITNENGEVLLVKNPRRGWEFPGGQVENGEDLMVALQREIQEESGIIAEIKTLVGVYSNTKGYMGWDNESYVTTKVMFGFLGESAGGSLETSEESLEVGWFKREEVLGMITNEFLRDRARDMLEFKGQVIYRSYTTNPYEVNKEVYV